MAIKTDIYKAYGRMEWNFLEETMSRLGYHPRWIQWIMACVRSVSYSVNCSPYGEIIPQCGIRQGDSLSPYLFLLCAEMLTQKLNRKEEKGKNRRNFYKYQWSSC